MNQEAKSLAGKLAPAAMGPKVEPGHLAGVEQRLAQVLEHLGKSVRGSGPPPRDLLNQAYAMRDDVSADFVHLSVAAIIDAWEAADGLGLFDESGRFDGKIRKGAEAGQKAVFQYIVPARYVPEFSSSFCNVEIVTPGKRRQSDEASDLSPRVIAYGKALREHARREGFVVTAADRQKTADAEHHDLNRTRKEYLERWEELRAADPESAKRVPNISARIQRMSTPSKKSGGKYEFRLEVENRSEFPTEVSFVYYFIGKPKKDPKKPDAPLDDYTYMLEKSRTIRLLPGGKEEFVESFAEGNADYRGYAGAVSFNNEIISKTASDARMESLIGKP